MWQKTQLEKLGVEVRYQTELTKAIVEEEKPDTVVVATGSHPFVPPFPGKDQEFVVSAVDLLRGKIQADGNIAVIGGGLVGGETANFLATHGNQVTIIEMLAQIVGEEPDNMKRFLLQSFEDHHVDIHAGTAVQTINEDRTITVKAGEEEKVLGPFDKIVTAVGMRANLELKGTLEDIVKEVVYVGDALKPGKRAECHRGRLYGSAGYINDTSQLLKQKIMETGMLRKAACLFVKKNQEINII